MARVFVYGTLKTGQPNYFRMEKALKAGVVKFVGKARTVDLFPLIIAGRFNIPYLLWAKGKGNHVFGEVYDVDKDTLKQLDILEGVPYHYQIENIEMELLTDQGPAGVSRTECVTYICKEFKPEMLDRIYYDDYDSYGGHGLKYAMEHMNVDQDFRFDVLKRPDSL